MAMSFKAITDRTHSFSMRCAKRKELGETISTDVTVALFALKLWMFCDYLMIFIHSFLFYFWGVIYMGSRDILPILGSK